MCDECGAEDLPLVAVKVKRKVAGEPVTLVAYLCASCRKIEREKGKQ